MAPQTEQSKPDNLASAELNPLLNPLLAQNMGRWAEVYFNTPAEKRNEAVQHLLRQIESENSTNGTKNGTSAASASKVTDPDAEPLSPSSALEPVVSHESERPAPQTPESHSNPPDAVQAEILHVAEAPAPVCPNCGRRNDAAQRFCGECGTRLPSERSNGDLHNVALQEANPQEEYAEDGETAAYTGSDDSQIFYDEQPYEQQRFNPNELSLFQNIQDRDYHAHQDDDEIFTGPISSGSHRGWIGLILVIILGGLGYMAWRSGMLQSSPDSPLAPAPETTKQEPDNSGPAGPAASAPAAAKANAPSENAPAGRSAPPHAVSPTTEEPKPPQASQKEASTSSTEAKNVPPPAPRKQRTPAKAQHAEPAPVAGAEELSVAQGYLNGANGQRRNSAEGAKWLWKAVAKHNPDATFLLSDLYLKGDGVSKNCDQARVLLDAAVMEGVKGAGQRLRHLQAFGCQ